MNNIRDEFESISRMLADKYNITLRFEDGKCCTDGRTIILPILPVEVDPKVKAALHGYLDHEIGHILGDSDSNVLEQAIREHGKLGRAVVNGLEDVRVENVVEDRYPGASWNLRKAKELTDEKNESANKEFSGIWLTGVACYFIGKGVTERKPYVDQIIWDTIMGMRDLCLAAGAAKSTAEVYEISKQIIANIKKEEEKHEPPPPPPIIDGDFSTPRPEGDGDPQPAEGEGGSGSGDGNNPQGEGEGSGKPDECSGESGADGGRGEGESGTEGDGGGAGKANPFLREGESGVDIGKSIVEEVRKTSDVNYGTPDETEIRMSELRIAIVRGKSDSRIVSRILNEHATVAGGVRQRMIQLIRSLDRTDWQRELTSGKLDGSRLHALGSRCSAKVFRRKSVEVAPNTAVSLLIDTSGSMSHHEGPANTRRITMAKAAAVILGDCLERLRQEYEITAFGMGRSLVTGKARLSGSSCSYYTAIIKPFGVRLRDVGDHLADLVPTGGTPMTQGIYWTGKRLRERREPRKILIGLTDGACSSRPMAKREVDLLKASGVEVMFIGMGEGTAQHVSSFGVPWTNVADPAELPAKMLELLMKQETRTCAPA